MGFRPLERLWGVPLGAGQREVQLTVSSEEAFRRAEAALAALGTVRERDPSSGFIRGTAKYGLQKVRVKVKIESGDRASSISIRTQGDDIWGKGARTVAERIARTLEELT